MIKENEDHRAFQKRNLRREEINQNRITKGNYNCKGEIFMSGSERIRTILFVLELVCMAGVFDLIFIYGTSNIVEKCLMLIPFLLILLMLKVLTQEEGNKVIIFTTVIFVLVGLLEWSIPLLIGGSAS